MNQKARKPKLLILLPGPNYSLSRSLKLKLEQLSPFYTGLVVSTSNSTWVRKYMGFVAVTLKQRRYKVTNFVAYLLFVLRVVRSSKGRGQPDLVITYDPLKSGLVGSIVKILTGATFLCEVNGDYNDPANYADVDSKVIRWIKRRVYVLVERWVLKRADAIKLLYESQIDVLGIDLRRKIVRSYPNLVSTKKFVDNGSEKTFLSVGFPLYVKGMDVLIDAFKSIAHQVPEWKLKIVGYYPDRSAIDRMIGGAERIQVEDPVSHDEIAKVIGSCGIFVLASRTEAMGRVLVESMAAGKPRIGTAVGGIPNVIHSGVDGVVVPAEDPSALASAMLMLAEDESLRISMGAAAAARAESEFSPGKWAERTMAMYSEAMTEKTRVGG